jgi:EAL domain-containing protein (putative c-di-GMP-specific phosphodiesterase class I)
MRQKTAPESANDEGAVSRSVSGAATGADGVQPGSTTVKCVGCQNDEPLGFDFDMAFQPIIDVSAEQRVWGYEALVRGLNGEPAPSILTQVTAANRYKFDQACRVKAIERAAERFDRPDLMLSINFMPDAVYEPTACIRATLDAANRTGFDRSRLMFEFTENEPMRDPGHIGQLSRPIVISVS